MKNKTHLLSDPVPRAGLRHYKLVQYHRVSRFHPELKVSSSTLGLKVAPYQDLLDKASQRMQYVLE